MERIREDLSLDNMEEEADEIVMNTHEWYPFRSKMVRVETQFMK
jgi:hypothetical protein